MNNVRDDFNNNVYCSQGFTEHGLKSWAGLWLNNSLVASAMNIKLTSKLVLLEKPAICVVD